MTWMTQKAVAARVALTGFVAGAFERMRDDERGQGSVEYIGIIVVVVAIVAAVAAFVANSTLDETIIGKIEEAINAVKTTT